MTDELESSPVLGDLRSLEGGRLVFLGTRPDEPDTWFVGFRNSAGDVLKFKLSDEAMRALLELVRLHPPSVPVTFPPRKDPRRAWHLVETEREKLRDALRGDDPDRG